MNSTILLVEDDPMCRKAMSRFLSHMDYSVAEAENGADALKWIAEHGDPGVIITDIQMPVMRGDEFMAVYEGKTPVIVCSSVGSIIPLPRKPFAIADKPVAMSELAEILRSALS